MFNDTGMPVTGNNYTKFVQTLTMVLASGITAGKMTDILNKGRIYKLAITGNSKRLINFFNNDLQKECDKQVLNNTGSGTYQRKYSAVNANLDDLTSYSLSTY